ncbi:Uncharacterised protein [Chlamydia trachomatis]|nr:Uncharacterised protein [Chlamydia trachomatis]
MPLRILVRCGLYPRDLNDLRFQTPGGSLCVVLIRERALSILHHLLNPVSASRLRFE